MNPPRLFVLGSFIQAQIMRLSRLPGPGESLPAHGRMVEIGGKGLNLLIGAHRLGACVRGVIPAGDDPEGDALVQLLREQGLDEGCVLRVPGASGQGVGLVGEDGENMIAIWPGANALLDAVHVRALAGQVQAAQLVCAQFEIGDAPILAAFELARGAGIPTLLNAAPFRPLSPQLLALTDVLVLNRSEAAAWLRCDEVAVDAEHDLRGRGFGGVLVITLGRDGALALGTGEQSLRQPGFVIEAQDSTGAGDAFCAGLAVALAQTGDWSRALRQGCACGALVARSHGVLSALPDADQVSTMLQDGRPSLS
jgi:ribokinase